MKNAHILFWNASRHLEIETAVAAQAIFSTKEKYNVDIDSLTDISGTMVAAFGDVVIGVGYLDENQTPTKLCLVTKPSHEIPMDEILNSHVKLPNGDVVTFYLSSDSTSFYVDHRGELGGESFGALHVECDAKNPVPSGYGFNPYLVRDYPHIPGKRALAILHLAQDVLICIQCSCHMCMVEQYILNIGLETFIESVKCSPTTKVAHNLRDSDRFLYIYEEEALRALIAHYWGIKY